MTEFRPRTAMVLAAGLGTRMRPLTDTMPKPLVAVGGKPLLDRVLDRLAAAGVETAVVNVHHLADRIENHLAGRRVPENRDFRRARHAARYRRRRRQGAAASRSGAILSAQLRHDLDRRGKPNLVRLAEAFDASRMDALLLVAAAACSSIGYAGPGDFVMATDGRLRRRAEREVVPFVYAGVADPQSRPVRRSPPEGAFSLNLLFDRAIAAGPAVRPAARRRVDACRNAGGGRCRGSSDRCQCGLRAEHVRHPAMTAAARLQHTAISAIPADACPRLDGGPAC